MIHFLKPSISGISTLDPRIGSQTMKRADKELGSQAYKRWAAAVKERAGWRCEEIIDGRRCERSRARGDRMIADHVVERKDGGALLDPANGKCVCFSHHTTKTNMARAVRQRR